MGVLPIRVLLIEDSPGDARLLRQMLAESGSERFTVFHADRFKAALAQLTQSAFDIILTDLNLPDSSGADTYTTLLARAPHIPLVVLTGQDDDALAVLAVQAGAQDYLVKGSVDEHLLFRSIHYAIERQRAAGIIRSLNVTLSRQNDYLSILHNIALDLLNRRELADLLKRIVERVTSLVQAPFGFISVIEGEWAVVKAVTGQAPAQMSERLHLGDGLVGRVWETQQPIILDDYHTWPFRLSPLSDSGVYAIAALPIWSGKACAGVLCVAHYQPEQRFDADQVQILQRFAELASLVLDNLSLYATVRERETQQRAILNNIPDIAWLKDRASRFIAVNDAFVRVSGLAAETILGKTDREIWAGPLAERYLHDDALVIASGQQLQVEEPWLSVNDPTSPRIVETIKAPIFAQADNIIGTTGIARDITDRKRAERRLNAQYAITRILAETASLVEAAPEILNAISDSLEWDTGELWLVDETQEYLSLVELWHSPEISSHEFAAFTRQRTFTRGDGFSGRVWANGQPLWMANVMTEPNFPPLKIAGAAGLHGAFGFPIILGGEVLGVMTFFSRAIRPPDDDLLQMFAAIGSQIGQFVERRRAERALQESEAKLDYLLRRFVPNSVAEQLIANHQHGVRLGGERRIVSVLFADIRGYTALTEALDPPALMDLLNKYFGIVGRVIIKHGGTINQYAGDMIMASFNAPDTQPDHARRAVRAALEAQAELTAHRQRGTTTLAFATLGETTNIAFRLSSMAEGGQVLVGPDTLLEVGMHLNVRPLGPLKLKGRSQLLPVHIVESWRD